MKKIIAIALLVLPAVSIANPSPFGLEIGKATIKEVKAKYRTSNVQINNYSHGEQYNLDVKEIAFDGLQEATVIFSPEGTLLAVTATLRKSKFDQIFNGLKNKYTLVSKKIPFVGTKGAKLVDGNTDIILNAPHLGFKMTMNYVNKDLMTSYEKQLKKDQQEKQKNEQSQL